jgi:5S rRNA maturation endonuclease (ribonuclease M5)
MRAPPEVRFERLRRLIDRVNDEAERGSVIVVEGIRDKESLRVMGVKGTILCLQSSRKNALGFAETLEGEKKVIVLTDFDREGVFLAKKLARTLTSLNIHPNLVLWRELRSVTRSDLRSIQELPTLYRRLQTELYFHHSPVVDIRHGI